MHSIGPGRERSPSRGRRDSKVCTKLEFTKLMSDIALLTKSMTEVKTHIGLIKSDNVSDGGQTITDVTVGDLAAATGTSLTGAAAAPDDSVIAKNTDRLNKLEDALLCISNKLTGIDAFMKDVRDEFTKMRKPATYSQIVNGMPLPPPPPSSPVPIPSSSASSSSSSSSPSPPLPSSSSSSSSPPSTGTSQAPNGHHPHPPYPAHHPPSYPAANTHNPATHPPMNPHQQSMHRNNYNDAHLDRVKQFKANCIIAFKIKEAYDDGRQYDVDKLHVRQILSDLNLEHLGIYENEAFEVNRVGKKDPSKIRPLRIKFDNNMTRETVIKNAWLLKFSIRYSNPDYPEGIFLSRDLTKEDRAIERTQYILRKQQRNMSTNNPSSNTVTQGTVVNIASIAASETSTGAGAGNDTHPRVVGTPNQT